MAMLDTLGQPNACNREVKIKKYEKILIKEVCIPTGYIIYYIDTDARTIDIDGDGLQDFIFDWAKKERAEGDTNFITAFRMNQDSTFSFLKTFKNILPLDLDSYDQPSQNSHYSKVWSECYGRTYPLKYLEFKNGIITLNITTEAISGLILEYKYSKEKNNWILKNIIEYVDNPQKGRIIEPYPMPEKEETIDDFSYEKYLCPESLIKE
ncbi:MAG: hypothetical protein ACJ75J_11860 [Cytophagaceae bacterium]